MAYMHSRVGLKPVGEPARDCTGIPVPLTDETIGKRRDAVLTRMAERGLDALVVYGDLEHGSNFEYLVGFLPRFEEALLVLHADGEAYLVLGNENMNKAPKSRIVATAVHAPHFSLPNQPMGNAEPFPAILARTGIRGRRVGVAGWKNFTSRVEDNRRTFDVPHYILSALDEVCGSENVTNECSLLIGDGGVRTVNNANEIAHYEFGAALSSDCMLDAMDALRPGVSEMEVGGLLARYGQRTSVVTVAAFGPRFVKANMYPTDRRLSIGDAVSLSVGYRGGYSGRAGVAVADAGQLGPGQEDYFDRVCAPYFAGIQAWLEQVRCGMSGGEMHSLVESVLPRKAYGWTLCPGHLTAEEEWMSSPIYEGSREPIRSGMMFETDIIPSVSGYPGVSAESALVVADAGLRKEIREEYPCMWARMQARRAYVTGVIGIRLRDDVLPLCASLGYMRPLMLSGDAVVADAG